MFVSVGPCIQVAYGVGMRFSAVDTSFSKHTIWRDGYFHLLTFRDGDNRMLPLAWALCETESGDTYKWFAEKCTEAGLSRYLNNASIIFSDRQKPSETHQRYWIHISRINGVGPTVYSHSW